jgi:hypothetical protein
MSMTLLQTSLAQEICCGASFFLLFPTLNCLSGCVQFSAFSCMSELVVHM